MKRIQLPIALIAATLLIGCQGYQTKISDTQQPLPKSRIEIIDPEALSLLDTSATIETVGKGFNWTEGPLYIQEGDYFIFSDIPENKVFKWKEGEGTSVYLTPSGNTGPPKPNSEQGSNGLLLDPGGNLILCQDGDRRMAKMLAPVSSPKPVFITLVDKY